MKRMKKLCALALSAVLLAQAGTTMAFAMSNTANQENCFASLVEAAAKTPAVTVTSTILGMADTGNKTSLKKTLQKTRLYAERTTQAGVGSAGKPTVHPASGKPV